MPRNGPGTASSVPRIPLAVAAAALHHWDGDWVEEADLVTRAKDRRALARAIAIDGDHRVGYVLDPEAGALRSFVLG